MTRTEFLRENTIRSVHKTARVYMPEEWDSRSLPLSLHERRASSIRTVLENMPCWIGEQELVVGTRTLYRRMSADSDRDKSYILFSRAVPPYFTAEDEEFYGYRGQNNSKGHQVAKYGIILELGIDGILTKTRARLEGEKDPMKIGFLKSVLIAYDGLSTLITRYSAFSSDFAAQTADKTRRAELERIARICAHIAHEAPTDFYEAVQLYWFSHLSLLVEAYCSMNYGRLDLYLEPFLGTIPREEEQQLIECLLLKMYDQVDIILPGNDQPLTYAAQHNLTIGGWKRDGSEGANDVTLMVLDGLSKTRLPEPLICLRYHRGTLPDLLFKACELSVSGMNFMAYYNDENIVKSLAAVGIAIEDARDYSFDLCQDVNIHGRSDFFTAGGVSYYDAVYKAMVECGDDCKFEDFFDSATSYMSEGIRKLIANFGGWEAAVRKFNAGDTAAFTEAVKRNEINPLPTMQSITAPMPLASALFDGCLESGIDLSSLGCIMEEKGVMLMQPVIAINSIAALRKVVFDDKLYKMSEVVAACAANFEGAEIMRTQLWNAPKWGNDDDYVDLPAKEFLEHGCREVLKYRTANGARYLAGIHQPHPVATGYGSGATPEGRLKGMPVPVTLSPENGTMRNGPTAALKSATKIDPMAYQWNNCVMLSYFKSSFSGIRGAKALEKLIETYFDLGGTQHQPNFADIAELRAAMETPDKYKDLIVRLWGVSAHFIDLSRDMQNELIARFEVEQK